MATTQRPTYPVCLEIHLVDCPCKLADAQLRSVEPGYRINVLDDGRTVASSYTPDDGPPVWVTADGRTFETLDAACDHDEESRAHPLRDDAHPYEVLVNELERIIGLLQKAPDDPRNGYPVAIAQQRLRVIKRDIDYSAGTPAYVNANQRRAKLNGSVNPRDFADDIDF